MPNSSYNDLCDVCQGVFATIREVGWHRCTPHHGSLHSLKTSASKHCGICAALLDHLEQSEQKDDPGFWGGMFPLSCESDTSAASWQRSFEVTFKSARPQPVRVGSLSEGMPVLNLEFTFVTIADQSGL